MYPQQSQQNSYGAPAAPLATGVSRLAYLRKVYGLFTTSIIAAAVGAMFALYAGTGASAATIRVGDTVAQVPPLVALQSGWIGMIVGFALVFGGFTIAMKMSAKPVVNVLALHGAAFISGVYIAPMVFFITIAASQGATLSPSPVRDAFVLASLAFSGLTAYTMISKKDFSFLGGFLSMGFWVVLGALVLNIFIGSAVFHLAVASVGVLLFCGYILYDTSRIMRAAPPPVAAAVMLYLDFFNLFMFLLTILGSRRS